MFKFDNKHKDEDEIMDDSLESSCEDDEEHASKVRISETQTIKSKKTNKTSHQRAKSRDAPVVSD